MSTIKQYEEVNRLLHELHSNHAIQIQFKINTLANGGNAIIIIKHDKKSWRFCDPNWDVVIKQLKRLQETLKCSKK